MIKNLLIGILVALVLFLIHRTYQLPMTSSTNLGLQEQCSKDARAEYLATGHTETDPTDGFEDHYSARLARCFVKIYSLTVGSGTIGKTSLTTAMSLEDANERRVYGEYMETDGKSIACYVVSESESQESCHSAEEFEALIKPYLQH